MSRALEGELNLDGKSKEEVLFTQWEEPEKISHILGCSVNLLKVLEYRRSFFLYCTQKLSHVSQPAHTPRGYHRRPFTLWTARKEQLGSVHLPTARAKGRISVRQLRGLPVLPSPIPGTLANVWPIANTSACTSLPREKDEIASDEGKAAGLTHFHLPRMGETATSL